MTSLPMTNDNLKKLKPITRAYLNLLLNNWYGGTDKHAIEIWNKKLQESPESCDGGGWETIKELLIVASNTLKVQK